MLGPTFNEYILKKYFTSIFAYTKDTHHNGMVHLRQTFKIFDYDNWVYCTNDSQNDTKNLDVVITELERMFTDTEKQDHSHGDTIQDIIPDLFLGSVPDKPCTGTTGAGHQIILVLGDHWKYLPSPIKDNVTKWMTCHNIDEHSADDPDHVFSKDRLGKGTNQQGTWMHVGIKISGFCEHTGGDHIAEHCHHNSKLPLPFDQKEEYLSDGPHPITSRTSFDDKTNWLTMLTPVLRDNPLSMSGEKLAVGLKALHIPLKFLFKTTGKLEGHQLYCHTIPKGEYSYHTENVQQYISDGRYSSYIGLTGRGWVRRNQEHMTDAIRGSHYRCHQALRNYTTSDSYLLAAGLSKDEANDLEEKWVDEYTLFPRGLNMIPGGLKGIKYLQSQGIKTRKGHTSERNPQLVNQHYEVCRTTGKRNIFEPPVWAYDDEVMSRIVLGRSDTFSKNELSRIRYLNEYLGSLDYSLDETQEYILEDLRLTTESEKRRLKLLLVGKTYSRIS